MNAVVSVIGRDRVGIIARLSNICADNNVNINDITQKVRHDTFTMIVGVDPRRGEGLCRLCQGDGKCGG